MKSYKVLTVSVIGLILINCALIGFLWARNYKKSNYQAPTAPPANIKGPAFEYLIRVLKMDSGQIKKYERLRKAHAELTRTAGALQRMQRDSFFGNLKNPNANPALFEQLEKRIMANQEKLDTATFYHFRRLRAILTPGQQSKFDSVITDVIHSIARQPSHPPGEGPGKNLRGRRMGGDGMPGPPSHRAHRDGPRGEEFGPDGEPPMGPDGKPLPPPDGRRPRLGPDGRPLPPPRPGEGPPPGGDPPPQQ